MRELIWESLEETWKRSAKLPTDSRIGNRASEKQAGRPPALVIALTSEERRARPPIRSWSRGHPPDGLL